MKIQEELKSIFKGGLDTRNESLQEFSHDASLFELKPKLIASHQDSAEIKTLVKYVL